MQEGFEAEDDIGARDDYTREVDEEAAIQKAQVGSQACDLVIACQRSVALSPLACAKYTFCTLLRLTADHTPGLVAAVAAHFAGCRPGLRSSDLTVYQLLVPRSSPCDSDCDACAQEDALAANRRAQEAAGGGAASSSSAAPDENGVNGRAHANGHAEPAAASSSGAVFILVENQLSALYYGRCTCSDVVTMTLETCEGFGWAVYMDAQSHAVHSAARRSPRAVASC